MDKGMESGSGIISSLLGMGSGSPRSLSPWKSAPCMLPILYYGKVVRLVVVFSEGASTYQTLCEHLELVLDYEVLLSKHNYRV